MLLLLKCLSLICKVNSFFPNSLFLFCCVLVLTHMSPTQDNAGSKIPDGEAQFTSEQLKEYYLVYKNPNVRYLRNLFDACIGKAGGMKEECQMLSKWDKEYLRSKFVVLSLEANTFGGTLIKIIFQDRPDKVFVAWIYLDSGKKLMLRRFEVGEFTDEDIRRINVRYKKLLKDRIHAM